MSPKKTCRACRKAMSRAAFNGSARAEDGLAAVCRACTNAARRQREASRPEARATTSLAAALRAGDTEAVLVRIRAGVRPDVSWVCETMRRGHVGLAEALLKKGVAPDVFTEAAVSDLAGLKRRLRRSPAEARRTADFEPGCRGVTPLHVACASDWLARGGECLAAQVHVADALLDHGADMNGRARYRNLDDATPLFCACWTSGNVTLVRRLLDRGAVADDRDLGAALGHFQRHGRPTLDVAEALLAWGVPVDGSTPAEGTPLHGFARHAAHRAVAWLLARGADVNARGPGGRTAAHVAAERNVGPTTLKVLAEHGADLTVRDDDGRTPLDLARLNAKARVVAWLRQHTNRRRAP